MESQENNITQSANTTETPKGVMTFYRVIRMFVMLFILLAIFAAIMVMFRWEDVAPKIEYTKNQVIGFGIFIAFYTPFILFVLSNIKKGKKWAIMTIIVLYVLNVISSIKQPSGAIIGSLLLIWSVLTYTKNKTFFR